MDDKCTACGSGLHNCLLPHGPYTLVEGGQRKFYCSHRCFIMRNSIGPVEGKIVRKISFEKYLDMNWQLVIEIAKQNSDKNVLFERPKNFIDEFLKFHGVEVGE